ncbi:hypothetical protein L6164_011374 [Bauhinia variegata]|uniref:Uncharacterized protein n=1 Tax=Bauhinia variegata TaxID=167791 RepID=A0ACB9PAW7_BAUVA|nr:hypothetical protein L6164_011374 [Bauhinia variegata]
MAQMPLQRSVTSFRRQGSSGLVWDDKVLSGLGLGSGAKNQSGPKQEDQENDQRGETREPRQSKAHGVGSTAMMERSRSEGARPYRTVTVAPASMDPPSPKATCALCGLFGKPVAAQSKSKSKKRR